VTARRDERALLFQGRLQEAMARQGASGSGLARRTGLNRSTVAQLLHGEPPRLPGGQALAALAGELSVTSDWLLGLVTDPTPIAEILDASVEIAAATYAPADENLLRWLREAEGYKTRHVPTTLPAPLKTEAVLAHEYCRRTGRTAAQAIADSRSRLHYSRETSGDIEIAMPLQDLEGFARGEGLWRSLPTPDRREQLGHMGALLGELYPRLRLHLFDRRTMFAAPVSVFGPLRAVVYLGQSYLVFNTTRHIRALSSQFDGLVRHAVVRSDEASAYVARLESTV
jgi:transcriptional regulator with XRE-family HTH domain